MERTSAWAKFRSLPGREKAALCEAATSLAIAQLMICCVPYSRWARMIGPILKESEVETPIADQRASIETVRAVDIAARHFPWQLVCLPRAMAAKWMLSRRNVPSVLHLGIRRDATAPSGTELHAWLSVGGEPWVGGEAADRFTLLARYGAAPRQGRVTKTTPPSRETAATSD
jgi:hypothetical protein